MLLTTITSVDPVESDASASAGNDISATFDQDLIAGSVTDQTFVVHGSQSGRLSGTDTVVSAAGAVATHNPTNNFAPGELVSVTATSGISTTGGAAIPKVWQFQTEVTSGSGLFVDSGQVFPFSGDQPAAFGDVDNDGDPDVLSGSGNGLLWTNDGTGTFTSSGQAIQAGGEPKFADADGDGDLDILSTTNVWINDGGGIYTNSGQNLGGGDSVTSGDVDGDGDIDVMLGVRYAPNRVWLNNGTGQFSNSGQALGSSSTTGLALADFDNDGDLDAFAANNGPQNRVWINDGAGNFVDSGQLLGGFSASFDVQVGDVDGDGDVDAVVGNEYSNIGARVWLNDGSAVFIDSGQNIASNGNSRITSLKLGDLDGDGDLDVFASNRRDPSQIWLNDGAGTFSDSGQRLTFTFNQRRMDHVDLADIDGDGDLDAWEQNVFPGGAKVWINQNLQPSVALTVDNTSIDEAAGTALVTATLSETHTSAVTVDLGFSGAATETDDYTVSATQIMIPVGSTTGSVTITAVEDSTDEPDETVVVDIIGVNNADEAGTQQVTTTILDNDEAIPVPEITLSVDNANVAEDGGIATFSVNLSVVTTIPVTVDLGFSGSADTSDYSASATQIVVAAGASSGSITVTAIDDTVDELDETVTVEIASVDGGTELGDQQATTTITDDDDIPPSFAVTSFEASASGFRVEFANELDPSDLNLYDTQNAGLGPADVVVTGAASGPVVGSLVIDASAVTFIKAGGPLAADTYTVTLRSAADGFQDTGAAMLDGDGDGTAGGDFQDTFTIDEAPAGARLIGIPDFVRGPGQDVNLPADGSGIPITISDGDNVRAADLRISYDPTLLAITGATAPAGGSVIVNTTTPGEAILVFFSSASLPAGSTTFITLQASVPPADASANYGRQQSLDIHSVTIGDGNDNEFAVVVDDAHHVVSYFADVSGNGRINASDAAQVARFAALIDSGFAGSLNADPITIGDISGNGRINAADASRVAQFAALIDVPEIPAVPAGIQIAGLVNRGLDDLETALDIVGPYSGPSEGGHAAESATPDFPVIENFVSKGSEPAIIDQLAADRMMADLANSAEDEPVELGSGSELEETLDELLSAVE